jgi:hypothetical protein
MKPAIQTLALSIMDEVLKHPGATLFAFPPEPGPDFPPEYFQIVKHPMDLSTVVHRLKARRYRNVSDWTRAVDLVFANVTTYYEDGPVVDLADEIHAFFQKQCERFNLLTLDGWCGEVLRLRDLIGKLNNNAPYPAALKALIKHGRISPQLATPPMVTKLVTTMAKNAAPDNHRAIGEILRTRNPDLLLSEGRNTIDPLLLTPATVTEVDRYFREMTEKSTE